MKDQVNQANELYWKHKYDELMAQYIKLEEKLYNIRTSVALLRDVMLEHGKAG